MLFQPTNILPDVINGNGQGTVDITEGLTVSWQINGNSQMTAYAINIFDNDYASTPVYATGKIDGTTDPNLPFSGISYKGDIQRFTALPIAANVLSAAGISNGNEYKLCITQWYMNPAGTETPIAQISLSVFRTREKPTLSITVPSTLAVREYSFTAEYRQDDGDAIAWVRWRLYQKIIDDMSDLDKHGLLEDTGKLYGVTTVKFDYDSFVNNTNYFVICEVSTSNGVVAQDIQHFSTAWATTTLPIHPTVSRINSQSTGIRVSWNEGFNYNQGIVLSGTYSIENETLHLPTPDDIIYWHGNDGDMRVNAPWMFIMQTQLQKASCDEVITITTTNGSMTIGYDMPSRTLTINDTITNDPNVPASIVSVAYEAYITIILTPDKLIIKKDYFTDGLVPSESLTPSTTLPPSEGTKYALYVYEFDVTYTQPKITKLEVSGAQDINYIQIFGETASPEDLETVIYAATEYLVIDPKCYTPQRYPFNGSEFSADFSDGTINGGTFRIGNDNIVGWAVYRRNITELTTVHLLDVPNGITSIIDYGVGSGYGSYYYDIYPIGEVTYLTSPITTRQIAPLFANWAIIEAEKMPDGHYHVINEYVFGKNLSSGAVSNNNNPSVTQNFTRYATVQMSHSNYQSGTLTSLIGQISFFSYVVQEGDTLTSIANRFNTTPEKIYADNENVSDANFVPAGTVIQIWYPDGLSEYNDDKKLRDDIWNLSTTKNYLFLKSRKGDVIEIRIAGAISMETQDATIKQILSASIPWVQIGDASRESLIGGAY